MNATRFVSLARLVSIAGLVLASATAAQAGGRDNVYWAVNIDAPTQGNGRIATSFSNTRAGVYGQPAQVIYAPPPVVIHSPGYVYYRGVPAYGHDHHHHHHHHHHAHGFRPAQAASHLHMGLARLHQGMADRHAQRAQAWAGGRHDHRGGHRR